MSSISTNWFFGPLAHKYVKGVKLATREAMVAIFNLDPGNFNDFGMLDMTKMAETTAHEMGKDEWLDDETHWIWDLAADFSEVCGLE